MGMWRKERREGENGEQKVRVEEQVLKRERERGAVLLSDVLKSSLNINKLTGGQEASIGSHIPVLYNSYCSPKWTKELLVIHNSIPESWISTPPKLLNRPLRTFLAVFWKKALHILAGLVEM